MKVEWILSSSVLILLVLLVRFFLRKKVRPCLRYALWLVVALRLLLPVSISETAVSILNLLPGQNTIGEGQENRIGQVTDEKHKKSASGMESEAWMNPGADVETEPGKGLAGKTAQTQDAEVGRDEVKAQGSIGRPDFPGAFRLLWLLGAILCGGVFLVVYLDYGRRLGRSRKSLEPESLPVPWEWEIPVYETQTVQSPCLFGLLHPAVYVTEDTVREEQSFRFVLCHEGMHYRQHDNWWAFVRILCLCLHWFNPLVWLAARLSRQDGEMACDERTLRMLGSRVRVDYGKMLLELSAEETSRLSGWRISTGMSGDARQMRERLLMILNTPGRTAGIQILLAVLVMLLSVVTFTGKSSAQEKENPEAFQTPRPAETAKAYMDIVSAEGMSRVYGISAEGAADGTQAGSGVDEKEKWIAENVLDSEERKATIYYRYDENNRLHMVKYVEEDNSPDALFPRLDLTYVEDGGPYTLPAVADETELHRTMISMAVQSLEELYQWTGAKVDTVCFQITNMGDVYFGLTPEDIQHSRIFFSRAFGWDTRYNLSNYEKSISSMYVFSGRSIWYSPVLWNVFPHQMEEMTDEEIITWYLERSPLVKNCQVKSIEKRYEDTWTVQTQDGLWLEATYDVKLKEISSVIGPYPDDPVH